MEERPFSGVIQICSNKSKHLGKVIHCKSEILKEWQIEDSASNSILAKKKKKKKKETITAIGLLSAMPCKRR